MVSYAWINTGAIIGTVATLTHPTQQTVSLK
jgi:hypothetical protein